MMTYWFSRILTEAEAYELILLAGYRPGGHVLMQTGRVVGARMAAAEWTDWERAHPGIAGARKGANSDRDETGK
jgi:hypothetical protein